MAEVKIQERSTDWCVNYGHNNTPSPYGDYRYFWVIYYEQTDDDKKNNRSKVIVDQYIQVHFVESHPDDWMASGYTYYPSGSGNTMIDDVWQTAQSNESATIQLGESYALHFRKRYTKTLQHNSDGTRSFTWQGKGFDRYSSKYTYTLPQILRPTIFNNVGTFDIDNGVSIPVTKYVSTYYDVLEISSGSFTKTIENFTNGIATNTSVSIPVTFTEAELDDIYSKIPTGENANFTFKLTTYKASDKGTTIGTNSTTAVGNFTILLPTVRGAICTDIDTENQRLTGDTTNQTIINRISQLQVSFPTNISAIANTRKSTIVKYVVEGETMKFNSSGTNVYLGSRAFNKDYVTIYAVDSRGTSSLAYTQKFTKFIDYDIVTVNTKNFTISRQNNGVSRFIDISFEGTWWNNNFGVVQNSLTPYVYYRVNEGNIWNDIYEFLDGASVGQLDSSKIDLSTSGVFKYSGPIMSAESDKGFDIKNSYDIFVGFKDELSDMGLTITAPYGEPAAAVYKNKMSLGGPYDESLGGTQMWGDVYLNGHPLFPIGYIYMSVDPTNPKTFFGGEWEQIKDTFLLASGSKYNAGDTGGEEEVTLEIEQIPSHQHSLINNNSGGESAGDVTSHGVTAVSNVGYWGNVKTHYAGGGQAHNNMPPYLVVYMWKRIA